MARNDPTAEYVRSLLDYDPVTGCIFWRIDRARRKVKKGELAGVIDPRGYIRITINYQRFLAHRLAWLIMTGEWPTHYIDHRDHNQANNQWSNLRIATPSQNQYNRNGASKNSKSRIRGVCKTKNRWQASIWANHKQYYLGLFKTKEEAAAAYAEAAKRLHGEFANPQRPHQEHPA